MFAATLQISTEKWEGRRRSSPAVLIELEKTAEHFTRFAKKKLNSKLLVRNKARIAGAKNTTTRQMTNVLFEDLWGISSRLGASLNFPRNMLIKTVSLHLSEQACFEV